MLILATFFPLIFTQVFADSFVEDFEESVITLFYTDKKQYTDKDLIKITGLVSTLDSPTVLIGVYDPFGMPAGFYIVSIDSDLEFSTSFPVKAGVNFRTDGTYSIKAHYAETKATSFFDYYEILQPISEETIEEPVETIEEPVETIEEPVETIEEPVETIEEPVETIEEPVETIEEPVETIEEPVETIEEPVETIEEPVETIEEPVETIEEPVEDKIISDVTNISLDEQIIKEESNDNYKPVKKNPIISDPKKITPTTAIKKYSNLTVEDIELGKLLNQINLKCDSSTFTDTISYYDGMGPALYRLCKFDSSLSLFNDSLINNSNDIEILVNKGSTLGKLGYFSEAIVYYDKAINIDPNFLPAKNNKANALANLGNFDEAISLYNEILVKNPTYTTAEKNLEIALLETVESETENVVYQQFTLPEKNISFESKKQKPTNFFEEINHAFSSLGSLFGFLN